MERLALIVKLHQRQILWQMLHDCFIELGTQPGIVGKRQVDVLIKIYLFGIYEVLVCRGLFAMMIIL